jgi:hypothetical protein
MTPALRLLAITLLLALAAVRAPSGVGAPVEPLTLDGAYRNMRDALTSEGRIARITIDSEAILGAEPYRTSTTVWLDMFAGAARSEVATTYGAAPYAPQRYTTIITDASAFLIEDGKAPLRRASHRCRSAPEAALSALLGCRGAIERDESVRVATGLQYNGVEAIAIVSESELRGRDGTMRFIDTLYIDATTFLPLALHSDGRGGIAARATTQYHVDFIDSTPDVAALLAPPPAPTPGEPSRLLLTVVDRPYWLGHEFRATEHAPPLALQAVFAPEPGALPVAGARARIVYSAGADARAPDALTLQIWDAGAWRTSASARALPAIEIDGTVVAIDAHAPEYATADAITAIIGGLRELGE